MASAKIMSAPAARYASARVDSGIQSFTCDGVRSGHNDEIGVRTSVDGRRNAVAHLGCRDELLSGPVPATLSLYLVFEVQARGPGAGQFPVPSARS